MIFKIMIPMTIVIRLLSITGSLNSIAGILEPIMRLVGLPGSSALVWCSTLLTNIYGGMLAYFSLATQPTLSIAQISVLSYMMLVAHTLPIELQVASKAGVRLWVMLVIRIGFAIVGGYILFLIYSKFEILEGASNMKFAINPARDTSWGTWAAEEFKNYVFFFVAIFFLLFLMRILKSIGAIDLLNRGLKPLIKILGISAAVIPITVIGLTLGLLYGGALIISEAKSGNLDKMEIFYSLLLMGLCHSLIEDSLLMMSLGAHYSAVFIFRILFALIVTYIFVQVTRRDTAGRWKKLLTKSK
ncbi:MAG TPA: hypothetical protein VF691_21455 [Cytophagaceae bacterium]